MMSVRRLVGVWCLLVIVMIANGIFRELVMRPRLGPAAADVASALLAAAVMLAGTWLFFRPLAHDSTAHLVRASALLVVLTVAFEFLFGHYVDGKSWSDLLANYAIWRGRLWPALLVLLALTPFLWGRWFAGRASDAR
jgi:hypothetical protein